MNCSQKICSVFYKIATTSFVALFFFAQSSPAFADKPDRCFHKHYNNKSTCKAGIRGKKCSDAKGNKGKCVQNSTKCYCKIYKKKKNANKEMLDLGVDVGISILKSKKHKKHKKHHKYHD
ncbi:MAG: hypothetical protein ACRBBJ_00140 [Rhodomicrobiaceae bacterium]